MSLRFDLLPLLFMLMLASFACRAAGFWLMRFVTVTPRVEAALNAAPLAVMVGIVTPTALRGDPAALFGLAVVVIVMRVSRNDLVAALSGVAAVAVFRAVLRAIGSA